MFVTLALPFTAKAMTKIESPIPAHLVENAPEPFTVQLTNPSDVPVEALVIDWYTAPRADVGMGPLGQLSSTPTARTIENGFAIRSQPVLDARGTGVFGFHTMSQFADPHGPARIVVDAVLYTDGTVVGPNQFNLEKYVADKWAALEEITAYVVGHEGRPAAELLDQLRSRFEVADTPAGMDPNYHAALRAYASFYASDVENAMRISGTRQISRESTLWKGVSAAQEFLKTKKFQSRLVQTKGDAK